jgi:glycosyltransferase involved in cell wall biosynthesis
MNPSISIGLPTLQPPHPALLAVVVVPARDEELRIEACLQALAAQEGLARESYEVIVVLDGCRDGTRERLAAFCAEEPGLHRARC